MFLKKSRETQGLNGNGSFKCWKLKEKIIILSFELPLQAQRKNSQKQ